jgi:hypothetical protein
LNVNEYLQSKGAVKKQDAYQSYSYLRENMINDVDSEDEVE